MNTSRSPERAPTGAQFGQIGLLSSSCTYAGRQSTCERLSLMCMLMMAANVLPYITTCISSSYIYISKAGHVITRGPIYYVSKVNVRAAAGACNSSQLIITMIQHSYTALMVCQMTIGLQQMFHAVQAGR